MRRALLLPLALAALAAGCGTTSSSSGGFEGEERRVAEVVEKIQSAGEAGDAAELCSDVLATALREAIEEAGSTCQVEMDNAIRDADDFELVVEDVTVDGEQATARVRGRVGDGEETREFEFEQENGAWRATSLGAD